MSEFVELCGTLEKQIYKSPENGFSVFSLKINSKQSITIQGYLPQVHQGENVTLKGKWSFHKKFIAFQAKGQSIKRVGKGKT